VSGQEKPLELSNGKAFHEWQHDWEKARMWRCEKYDFKT
jgi:hypothetical protein